MLVGYGRVSSNRQETDLQRDAFERAGVDIVIEEKRGARKKRPMLGKVLRTLRPGDTLVVWKFDRIARSVADLVRIIEQVEAYGACFRSLTEPVDTGTHMGRLLMHMLGAVAEFEWSVIRERSMAGQDAARRRGARIGRPRALSPAQEADCLKRLGEGESMSALAREFGVHMSSIKRVRLRAYNKV